MFKKIVSIALVLVFVFGFGANVFALDEWALNYSYEYTGFFGADKPGAVEQSSENTMMPVDTAVKYNGKNSMRFNIKESIGWWVCFVNKLRISDGNALKLTPYLEKGSLQFAVKGEKGGETFGIGFADNASPQMTAAVKVTATTEWQVVNIPIQKLKDTQPFIDLDNLNAFYLAYSTNDAMKFWIADVKVITTTPATTATVATTTAATTAAATTAATTAATQPTEGTAADNDNTDADSTTAIAGANTTAAAGDSTDGTAASDTDGEPQPGNLWVYILIGVIILIAAGGAAAVILLNKKRNENAPADGTDN